MTLNTLSRNFRSKSHSWLCLLYLLLSPQIFLFSFRKKEETESSQVASFWLWFFGRWDNEAPRGVKCQDILGTLIGLLNHFLIGGGGVGRDDEGPAPFRLQ